MSSSPTDMKPASTVRDRSTEPWSTEQQQLSRWGGAAGLGGFAMLLGSVVVVVTMGLPDASDPETLTDFADIESGRIAEHLFYLGALVLFALHYSTLHRLLRAAHPPAALFGTVVATTGLGIMAASSLLHVSTTPLADLYTAPDTPAEDLAAIEYAWHGAQSVFDTMLAAGVLLVPIGIVLFGVAMRPALRFGTKIAAFTITIGLLGTLGALVEVVDSTSDASAAAVLAIAVFHLVVGLKTWRLGAEVDDPQPVTT